MNVQKSCFMSSHVGIFIKLFKPMMAQKQDQLLLPIIILSAIIVSSCAQTFDCDCNCNRKEKERCNDLLEQPEFQEDDGISSESPMCNLRILPQCDDSGDDTNRRRECTHWECCKVNEKKIQCGTSGQFASNGYCASPTTDQTCYIVKCLCELDSSMTQRPRKKESSTTQMSIGSTVKKEHQRQQRKLSKRTSLGIGLGIGFLILIAVIIALMAYCRKQGIKEGRKQTTAPSKHNVEIDRENSLGDYAEIGGNLYLGQQTVAGTTNPGYETVPKDTIIQGTTNSEYTDLSKPDITTKSHYQSLKKHSNDFESPDYIDPEKYTEPPHLKISDEHEDEDDYVRQSTPSATGKNDEDHLKSPQVCDDYVDASLKDTNQHAHNKGHFAPKHDNIKETNSDYVNVDDQNLSKSQKPSGSKDASDYVDVDDQNLLKSQMPSGSSDASDYVDVDDPGLETESKSIEANAGSDYIDVDDPNLTKGISKAEPDSDYVKV